MRACEWGTAHGCDILQTGHVYMGEGQVCEGIDVWNGFEVYSNVTTWGYYVMV